MVLLLGSRAGGLFRSKDFFATLKEYSMRSFDLLSREGQFAESYKVLKQDRFNEKTIYALLVYPYKVLPSPKQIFISHNL